MKSINKVILVGRLGKDPEGRTFDGGNVRSAFSVATSKSYKRKGDDQWVEETQWHNIIVWGKSAEYANNHLKKGDVVHVEGEITHRSYVDSSDITRYVTEVVASNVSIFERYKNNAESQQQQQSTNNAPATGGADIPDDLPF
jgi:single-strand DNA-binding protein